MAVYRNKAPLDVSTKSDSSPVTAADLAAHRVIVEGLALLTPNIPVLSEESPQEWQVRRKWNRYWLVDPLDGTKEFLARNDEFTVNIALIEDGEPVMGVVYAPALKVLYAAEAQKPGRKKTACAAKSALSRPIRQRWCAAVPIRMNS